MSQQWQAHQHPGAWQEHPGAWQQHPGSWQQHPGHWQQAQWPAGAWQPSGAPQGHWPHPQQPWTMQQGPPPQQQPAPPLPPHAAAPPPSAAQPSVAGAESPPPLPLGAPPLPEGPPPPAAHMAPPHPGPGAHPQQQQAYPQPAPPQHRHPPHAYQQQPYHQPQPPLHPHAHHHPHAQPVHGGGWAQAPRPPPLHPPGVPRPAVPPVAAPPVAALPAAPGPAAAAAPAPGAAQQPQRPRPQVTCDALELLRPGPGRQRRPARLAVLLRGLPGSGKSRAARLLRDAEVAAGGQPPRILSLDDYFMAEADEGGPPAGGAAAGARGRTRPAEPRLEYRYEQEMEAAYRASLLKAFQRAVAEARSPLIVVDAPAIRVAHFHEFWLAGQAAGYDVWVAAPPETDPQACYARCAARGRSREQVYALSAAWEPAPAAYPLLLLDGLLGRGAGGGGAGAGIAEVEMALEGEGEAEAEAEAAAAAAAGGGGREAEQAAAAEEEEEEETAQPAAASRWAATEPSDEGGEEEERRRRKKARGGGTGPAVDDWRELLEAAGAQRGSAGGATPRSILARRPGSGGPKKRVRWPDQERAAAGVGSAEAVEEEGFRIAGGPAAGVRAKAGLEQVFELRGLGPPAHLEDGGAGAAPHPAGFAAAAAAEHRAEAGLFRRLLLSRGGA